ncbi:hypothetical protein MVEN_02604500 [Mycena venus]|uniref:Chromo domain-containing protein n=1 Tax=Mycena venus TaxID=2733690 RepID=A0A8H6WT51_9AGAR|nr:hypothetical protein MVEN_02604500 [Mycena venus]
MIRMQLGVPYVQRVDGNPNHTVTVAVVHTSKSLAVFGQGISKRVGELERRLYVLAFGSNPRCSETETVVGLYKLGFKCNNRSAKPKPGSMDGSFSLASTVEKGSGTGVLSASALNIIHELQQLILPCCLSKFEWEMYKWWAKDNNVFVFGGLGPGATGLQMNHSSGMGGLDTEIGSLQGKWHADISDALPLWTLGILMLKLPPGSDPGPFMFARCGLYIRETGVLIIYLLFRGNNLHSGFHPSYIKDKRKAWISKEAIEAIYNLADPQDRCFFVPYPTQVAYSRTAELAVSPPLIFGNLGAPVQHKLHAKTFSQDGHTVLGSYRDRCTRMSWEIVWGAINALLFAGLELTMDVDELFRSIEYLDENGERQTVEPPERHDLKRDAAYITEMRQYLAWHFALSEKYLIHITKDGYQTVQACLQLHRQAQEQSFPLVERCSVPSASAILSDTAPEHLIVDVIMWHVRVEDKDEVMVVPEAKTDWLYHPNNRATIAGFIHRNIPLNSAPLRKLYERLLLVADMPAVVPPAIPELSDLVEVQMDDGAPRSPSSPLSEPLFFLDPDSPVDFELGDLPDSPVQTPFTGLLDLLIIDDDGRQSDMEDVVWQKHEDQPPPPRLEDDSTTTVAADLMAVGNDWEQPCSLSEDSFTATADSTHTQLENGAIQIDSTHEVPPAPSEDCSAATVAVGLAKVSATSQVNGGHEPLPLQLNEGLTAESVNAIPPDPAALASSSLDDYEIEAIIDYGFDKDKRQVWCVTWKGYPSMELAWLHSEEFCNAKDIFSEYNACNAIVVRDVASLEAEDPDAASPGSVEDPNSGCKSNAEPESDFESNPSPKRKRRHKRSIQQPAPAPPEPVPLEPFPREDSFKPCMDLMSTSVLRTELKALQDMLAAANPSHTFKLFNPSTLLTQLSEMNDTNNVLASYLQFDDAVSDFSASVRLAQLQQVVGLVEPLCTALWQTDVLKQAAQWELCRTLLIVYSWLMQTAPALASALILVHQRSGTTLSEQFPLLCPFNKPRRALC